MQPPDTNMLPPDTNMQPTELEQVMNNGMQFPAGLFKMATGQDFNLQNQKMEIDKEPGEVVLRFKLKYLSG